MAPKGRPRIVVVARILLLGVAELCKIEECRRFCCNARRMHGARRRRGKIVILVNINAAKLSLECQVISVQLLRSGKSADPCRTGLSLVLFPIDVSEVLFNKFH